MTKCKIYASNETLDFRIWCRFVKLLIVLPDIIYQPYGQHDIQCDKGKWSSSIIFYVERSQLMAVQIDHGYTKCIIEKMREDGDDQIS